jgi:2-dehydropantoate 2-reductase
MVKDNLKIVMFGSGVIGGSVGGWIAEKYDNIYFLDQGEVAKNLRENGITLYPQNSPEQKSNIRVKVIESLDDAADADVVVIGVKNYSLEAVSKLIKEKVSDDTVIIGMQNGIENQRVLPKYFKKVIYCVVSYNAWMDEPGVIGYQKKGPLDIGTLDNSLQDEMKQISDIFNLGVETINTDRLQDAIQCKIVINLSNSLTTLIGFKYKEITNRKLFQKLLSNQLYEGTRIVRAAGTREVKLGGMPTWTLLKVGAKIPRFISKFMFEKNVKKMVLSSMAQDIIQRGGSQSELDTINGYIVDLAAKHGVDAPYNTAIYDLCKDHFNRDKFEPIDVEQVWTEIQKRM